MADTANIKRGEKLFKAECWHGNPVHVEEKTVKIAGASSFCVGGTRYAQPGTGAPWKRTKAEAIATAIQEKTNYENALKGRLNDRRRERKALETALASATGIPPVEPAIPTLRDALQGMVDYYGDSSPGEREETETVKAARAALDLAEPTTVLVYVRGGLVQGTSANGPASVFVIDYDTDGSSDECVKIEGEDVNAYEESPKVEPERVNAILQIVRPDIELAANGLWTCRHCGRAWSPLAWSTTEGSKDIPICCPSDDCPGREARAALAQI